MSKYIRRFAFLLLTVALTAATLTSIGEPALATVPGTNEIVSKTYTGGLGNNGSNTAIISPDGRTVVFKSSATNILASGGAGIFSRDLATGNISRISTSTSGSISDNPSSTIPTEVSATGRYVMFISRASNLIDGSPTSTTYSQVYLRDTKDSTTELISQSLSGVLSNGSVNYSVGVSSDGRFVSYYSNATNIHADATDGKAHLYMLDRVDNTLTLLDRKTDGTLGSSNFLSADMSCDGAIIVFEYGSNLIVGDTYSGHVDVYVLDRRGVEEKLTNLTKSANAAVQGPTISCNGDFIGMDTRANNLDPTISVTSGYRRPHAYDRVNESFHYLAVTTGGSSISSNVCVDYGCTRISDGGLAVFKANSSALTGVSGDQVYIRDIYTATTQLLSIDAAGNHGNASHYGARITAAGTMVAYESNSTNLVAGDTNNETDAFTSLTGY